MKMQERNIQKKQLYVICVKCGDEIRGTSQSQVLWNFDVHVKSKHQEPALTKEAIEWTRDIKTGKRVRVK